MSVSNKLLKAAAGASADSDPINLEQVFATHLYTGNGYSQFIKNGIDLGSGPTDGVAFHLRGDSFTDSSPVPKTVINSNNVPRSTSESKFGGGSYDFSGTNSVLRIAQSSATDLPGDFCFEYWFKGSHGSGHTIGDASTNTGAEFYIASNQIRMWINAGYISAAITYNSSQWNHIAWCRKGDKIYAIFNGVKTSEDTFTGTLSGDWRLGGYYYNGSIYSYDDGYYEDFRLTVGDYRYDGNISVPTALQPTVAAGEGKGGLVWTKVRSNGFSHALIDTERGVNNFLKANATNAQDTGHTDTITSFNSNGYNLGSDSSEWFWNRSGEEYVSWTWRKAPKFFDVKTVAHTSGSSTVVSFSDLGTIGVVIAKKTSSGEAWFFSHRYDNGKYLTLNTTDAAANTSGGYGISGTNFTIQAGLGSGTYVLYAFAHHANDGSETGFGPNGDSPVISCGSYTGNGSSTGPTVTLGFEPQWLLLKDASSTGNWRLFDSRRHLGVGNKDGLWPNSSAAEDAAFESQVNVTPTGFEITTTNGQINANTETYIFMAIARGTALPTSASDVFESDAYAGNQTADRDVTGKTNVLADLVLLSDKQGQSTSWNTYAHYIFDSMRSEDKSLSTSSTSVQVVGWRTYHTMSAPTAQGGWGLYGTNSTSSYLNKTGSDYVVHRWQRAPSYFDCVHYSGTGSAKTINHNLGLHGAVPEMIWTKNLSFTKNWAVYHKGLNGGTNPEQYAIRLDQNGGSFGGSDYWNNTAPTSSGFTVGSNDRTNKSGETFIAYLFSSLDGISKVGSFSHTNGSATDVNCGFSNGCRWVMLKRYNTSGSWIYFDAERGINSADEPFLKLDTADAEVTGNDVIDNISQGFQVQSGYLATGDWIFYAIAA